MEPLFSLTGIVFGHTSERPVFNGIDLTLNPSDRVALTGSNGSGKTTLLYLMVGLVRPQSGVLVAFGRHRRKEADFHEVRLRAGLLFDNSDSQLFCATVEDDVAFGPFNLGWPRARVEAAVRDTLERLDVATCRDRSPAELSYGEKRLVALATILAMEPDVMLLDEPTNGLDDSHVDTMVRALQTTKCALLVASHDRIFLKRVTTQCIRLDQGRIVSGSL